MKTILLAATIATAAGFAAGTAAAQDMVSFTVEQSFDDVIFGLENAIIDQGLVVDHISHVGEMLERTRADVGSEVVIFGRADVYSFCSASLSRQVMEANPMNITFCPYDIFVAELPDAPGSVTIGFRGFPDGEMQVIQGLLDKIVRDAVGME